MNIAAVLWDGRMECNFIILDAPADHIHKLKTLNPFSVGVQI